MCQAVGKWQQLHGNFCAETEIASIAKETACVPLTLDSVDETLFILLQTAFLQCSLPVSCLTIFLTNAFKQEIGYLTIRAQRVPRVSYMHIPAHQVINTS